MQNRATFNTGKLVSPTHCRTEQRLMISSHYPGLAARSGVKNEFSNEQAHCPSPTALGSLVCGSGRQDSWHSICFFYFLFPVYSRIHVSEAWILRGILLLLCTEETSSPFEHYFFFFFSFVRITFDSLLLFLVLLCNTTIGKLCA